MSLKIIGAGMSGLLAAQYFRSHMPIVYEKQKNLPNNHTALLRFRSRVVPKLTKINFKPVMIRKGIWDGDKICTISNLMLDNLYSIKSTGVVLSRSTVNMKPGTRYIAPNGFLRKLSHGVDIEYDYDAKALLVKQVIDDSNPLITTMPLAETAKILGYKLNQTLQHKSIETLTFLIGDPHIDVYQTMYYPVDGHAYRISITGDKVIAEALFDPEDVVKSTTFDKQVRDAVKYTFGIKIADSSMSTITVQKYGKLIPCDNNETRDFIGMLTTKHNIYSLGRWGTHRQILMDDVVQDLKIIDRMIETNRYRR